MTQKAKSQWATLAHASRLSLMALLSLVVFAGVGFAQIDRGTIEGLVSDQSGSVVPDAKVQVIRIDTNSTLELATNGEGLYTAPNLPAANYRVVVQKTGFSTITREPVEVRPRASVRVDVTLQPGAVTESVVVTGEAPLLDTATINNAAGFKQELIQELPLIVVGTKRDITGFLNNLPGTTNTNTFTPAVNGSMVGATEAFLDGAPASERIMVGALSENGPMMEQVGEVSVVSNAFNAEYGGFGNWFANVTIRSGTNELHGSVFDHLGNDKLNARSFFQPKRTAYRQNEGGFTLGGPVVIPHVYDGRNKTFFFGSLGVFFSRYGASGSIMTIPTQAFLRGDFSGLTSNGVQIPIFDPASTVPDGKGGFVRTQFPNNIIPQERISQAAKVVAQYMPNPTLPGVVNNFNSKAATSWPYYNTWVPLVKVDHSISSKQKIMVSYTYQKRPRIIWSGGMTDAPAWGQPQINPLDNVFDQVANSWKVRLGHDYVISPTIVNHITISTDRYYNLGLNKTNGQGWDQKLGITGIPADTGAFPEVRFSGGAVNPANLNRGYDENWHDLRYSFIENLTWIRGTHTMKFGFEIDRDRINRRFLGGAAGIFTFTNQMTSQPNSPNLGVWGNSYASFLLGAVGTATADIEPSWGSRLIRYGIFAQDEWRATRNLTLSYGLRWDYDPPISEVNNMISSFQPNLPNPGAGGRPGALAFIGSGQGRIGGNFQDGWKKGFGPRLGIAYQLNDKTVIRASSGIYYANSGNTVNPSIAGFGNTPSFTSGDNYTPLYYLDTGTFPQSFSRPPVMDPSFLNGQTIYFMPRTGTRLPQTISWTFGIQRQIAANTSIEATYIGSRSTHLPFQANYNYMPISNLQTYGGALLTQPITSPAAVAAGFTPPYPSFVNQRGANTVYQSLRPYPQYTNVLTSGGVFFGGGFPGGAADPVGQSKYNSLQIKANRRFSEGLTLFGFVTWSKGFTMVTDQYPGNRIYQLDAQPALVFSVSWVYDLPFGKGKSLLNTSNPVVNGIVSGWKINGFLKYNSGVPLSIAAGAGQLGAIGYSQRGNAVAGVSPYKVTNPRDFDPAKSKYLNSAAFTTSTGFNFGNLAPNLSWARGFWGKQEALTVGRTFRLAEHAVFDFSVDAQNPFNFVRWNNPNTVLVSPAFGVVTSAQPGRTLQINGAVKF